MISVPISTTELTPRVTPSDTVDVRRWYALYTCPRHEKRVAEQIEQRSISCFLPVYRSVRRWKDRRKELELALFPGYVFVRIDLKDRLRVLQLPSVVRFVSFNGQPTPLPEGEVESLINGLANGVCAAPHPYLTVGRHVRVIRGPLAGMQGILVRRKDRFRIVLSLDLIMRSVAVEVDESDVEPCSTSPRKNAQTAENLAATTRVKYRQGSL
jgi:transcription antitermination factor NusG